MFAAHSETLIFGIGRTESAALNDAAKAGADPDQCDLATISRRAADHVKAGGDCRALLWFTGGESDFVDLRAT